MRTESIVRRGQARDHCEPCFDHLEARSLLAADLAFSELDLDRSQLVTSREQFGYQFVVENRGNTRAPATRTTSVLSRDKVWGNADDVPIVGSLRVRALRPGESASWDVTVQPLPTTVPSGQYYIGRRVDPDGRVAERNERNNVKWSGNFIVVPDRRLFPKIAVRAIGETGPGPLLINNDPTPTAAEGTRFDAAEIDGYETRTFEISNTGTTTMYIFGVDVRLTAPHDSGLDLPDDGWAVTKAPATRVPPGAKTRFEVGFVPSEPGTDYRGRITINSSDVSKRSFAFAVSGRSGTPEFEASIADEPVYLDTVWPVFVGVFDGVDPIDIPVTVTNTGTGVLRIAPPELPGLNDQTPFVLVSPPSEAIYLRAGETLTFTIRFVSSGPGSYSTSLTLTSGFESTDSWAQLVVGIELEVSAD